MTLVLNNWPSVAEIESSDESIITPSPVN
jgi:hypothetical protein